MLRKFVLPCLAAALFAQAGAAAAQTNYPAPREGTWVARDFRFHTGEVMPELRMHYRTVGEPTGEPVVVLHGTSGSGLGQLTPGYAGNLFGPGQALDASKYYIPHGSPWPILGSVALFTLMLGGLVLSLAASPPVAAMKPMSSGVMPACAIALSAASLPRSEVATPGSTTWRGPRSASRRAVAACSGRWFATGRCRRRTRPA